MCIYQILFCSFKKWFKIRQTRIDCQAAVKLLRQDKHVIIGGLRYIELTRDSGSA